MCTMLELQKLLIVETKSIKEVIYQKANRLTRKNFEFKELGECCQHHVFARLWTCPPPFIKSMQIYFFS